MNDLEQPTDGAADRIAELLRATGRRPAVPADRAARVESAVRSHWRKEVRRRALRRGAWIAAALATAATIVVALGLAGRQRALPREPARVAAVVERASGAAWSRSSTAAGRDAIPLGPTAPVEAGSELATEGHGLLALRMAGGHSVRLDRGTRVTVVSDRVIALDRGAVYVDSGTTGAPGSIEIRTPLGTVRDVGTQFEVRRIDTTVRVRVREGRIALGGTLASAELGAGHELALESDGRIARRELPAFGAEWDWTAEVAPMLALDGRSLGEFLSWIARERGLRLRFADAGLAAAAPGITLSGSIEGMSLDEALASVLPTCRMSHRIDGGVLLVRPADEPLGPAS